MKLQWHSTGERQVEIFLKSLKKLTRLGIEETTLSGQKPIP